MTIIMDDSKVTDVKQIEDFLSSTKDIQFKGLSRKAKYAWINKILDRFKYYSLTKKSKGFVRKYIMRITALSKAQITRLIDTKLKEGHIKASLSGKRGFRTIYGHAEKELLAETDNLHERLSGPATKHIFERQYNFFNDKRFERLKNISSSHIYNLRASKTYQIHSVTTGKTKSVQSSIGVRRKPDPKGEPGYLRVDTVHQGDRDGEKGVYHINLVDEILQWEIVISVEAINEANLITTLEIALFCFPVILRNFHSDNGSEFINKNIAKMLNRLLIEQTKSRSNKSNDNALAEGKNG
ncbi:MAG: DDE-type integrase/transposase/recombinase, partial [Elusimicrobiales bacterium]|nr:DDE-type integrase/transposase/recombinase [Elusimicrobiales bacterium]